MFPPALAAFGVVAAAISAAGMLVLDRVDIAATSSRLAAVGLAVATAVTVTGLVVGRSRWAQRHGWFLMAVSLAVAIVSRPIDAWWMVGVGLAGLTAIALGLPPVARWLASIDRRVPVPSEAVLLLLLLLDAPTVAAFIHPNGVTWPVVAASVVGWTLMWAYSQARVPALWAIRFGLPLVVLGWGWNARWWGWAMMGIVATGALWAAWRDGSLLAVQPLEPRRMIGRPILAELAPEDVRSVAGIDERGRRR